MKGSPSVCPLLIGVTFLTAVSGCALSTRDDSQSIASVPTPDTTASARLGIYNWGASSAGFSWSDPLNDPAALISQVGARTIRVALTTSDPYSGNQFSTLLSVAQSAPYETLFSSSNFDTYILTTYSVADNPSNGCLPLWYNGYATSDAQAETAEIESIASYLAATYPAKKFIIQNWEGDSAIGGLAEYCGAALTPTMWQGYTDWINARARGVINARNAGAANVFSGLEFNAVQRLDSTDAYYGNACTSADTTSVSPGCSWCDGSHPCVISTVAPNVSVDYLSYSSWQSDGVGMATSCYDSANNPKQCYGTDTGCTVCYDSNSNSVDCPPSCGGTGDAAPNDWMIRDRIKNDLSRAAALVPGATPANFIIGESGMDRGQWGEARQANRMSYLIDGFTGFGASYGIYWQVTDNAGGGGYGVFKPDTTEAMVGHAFEAFYRDPSIGGIWDDQANTPNTAHPGGYISLYGSNFEPVDNSVSIAGVALTVTYNSAGQINAVLPANVPSGDQTLTLVKNTSGQTTSFPITVVGSTSCTFTAPTSVAYNGSWSVDVEATPPGNHVYWYGTHNGATDAAGVPDGATPLTSSYGPFTNSGDVYTRYAVIEDAGGNPLCTTNAVSVVVLSPSGCGLSAASTIAHDGYWNVTVAAPSGNHVFWYGTHNGATDAVDVPDGATPLTSSYGPFTDSGDVFTRYAVVKDIHGTTICTTNTVTVSVL